MIALLSARFGRPAAVAIVVAAILAVAGLGAWRAVSTVNGWIASAATTARAERDAHWRAEIARANVEAATARAGQAAAAAALEAGAGVEIATLRQQLTQLETRNASLPDPDRCGLDRDRVRLLPR